MTRTIMTALLLTGLAGCSASVDSKVGQSESDSSQERTQLAAYAATAQFPRDVQPSKELPVGAVVGGDTIKIHNYSDQPLRDANVWVNGAFVRRVATIAPMGVVSIKRSQFYDATGRTLASQQTTITRVQVQAGDTVYNALGPVSDG